LRTRTFKPEDIARGQGKLLPMQFVWMLDSKSTYPSLVPGSCTSAGPITGFRAFDPRPTDASGVKVRFLIDGHGQPGAVKLEGAVDAALAGQVVRYLESCRFGFAPGDTATRTDTMNGRVLLH